MYPPAQQVQSDQHPAWSNLFQQQEQRQFEHYQQKKQLDQIRKFKYRDMLDQDIIAKNQKKMEDKLEGINNQKYWNENEQVITDMLSQQKNAQKLYYQKIGEENLILAQQRSDQIYNPGAVDPQFQTMEERLNFFRQKEAQIYQKNQNQMQKEFQKIQSINQQNQQALEGQKIVPLFPHQNIIRGSHNILNVERKHLHDRCDDVVYEQIKQKQAQKAKEMQDKIRERQLVEMQAKYLENQEKQLKEKRKQEYQRYSSDNNIQSQFLKQVHLRDSQMNRRETALNSQTQKTRDKNGVEITPIYSLEYNQYERQKQLSQIDRALSRQLSPPNSINQLSMNKIQSMSNLNSGNGAMIHSNNQNNQPSSTLARNGSISINRNTNSPPQNEINSHDSQTMRQQPLNHIQQNQSFIKKFQNHADNFNSIRVTNPQSLQNPQANFQGAQLLHRNVQQESNFIKDSFGINANHGYNIVSGHIMQS